MGGLQGHVPDKDDGATNNSSSTLCCWVVVFTLIQVTFSDIPSIRGTGSGFATQLRALATSSLDAQPNGIVHDIVDPSLYCRVLSAAEHETVMKEKRAEQPVEAYADTIADDGEERQVTLLGRTETDTNMTAACSMLFEETLKCHVVFRWVSTEIECMLNVVTS